MLIPRESPVLVMRNAVHLFGFSGHSFMMPWHQKESYSQCPEEIASLNMYAFILGLDGVLNLYGRSHVVRSTFAIM